MPKRILLIFSIVLLLSFNVSSVFAAPSTSSKSGSFSSKSSSKSSGRSSGKVTSPKSSTKSKPITGSPSKSKPTAPPSKGSSSFSSGSKKSTIPSTKPSVSSGYKRPSAAVNGSRVNPYSGRNYYGGSTYYVSPPYIGYHPSFYGHMTAFAAGSMLGSMFHPWGGYYPTSGASGGYVQQPFSFVSLLIDLIIFALIVWLIVWIFRRRRSY